MSEAACASQRLHTISLLGLLFPVISHLLLPVRSLALATILAITLQALLLLRLPAIQVCPFSLPRVVPRAFALSRNFAIEFAARGFTPATYLPAFFSSNVASTLAPIGFFHPVAVQMATAIATAIVFALEVATVVAIKLGRLI